MFVPLVGRVISIPVVSWIMVRQGRVGERFLLLERFIYISLSKSQLTPSRLGPGRISSLCESLRRVVFRMTIMIIRKSESRAAKWASASSDNHHRAKREVRLSRDLKRFRWQPPVTTPSSRLYIHASDYIWVQQLM